MRGVEENAHFSENSGYENFSLERCKELKECYIDLLNENNITTLPISDKTDKNNFYHEIIKINSISNFCEKGWERILNKTIDEVREQYLVPKYKYRVAINAGIFGFANTGKTYILQKISKRINIKYKESFERNFITETYETHLGLNLHYLIINETKVTIFFDTKGIGNIPYIKKAETGIEIANLYYDYFRINDFIEQFILNNTSTIFYVKGNEDEKEKKYYEKIKNECPKSSNLIIIHNLYKCNENEIEEKIKTFEENKGYTKIDENIFLERYEKDSNNNIYLKHVIMYNDFNKEGKEKNHKIFDFIEKTIIYSTKYSIVKESSFYKNKKNEDGMYLYTEPFIEFLANNSLKFFGFNLNVEDITIENSKIKIKKNEDYKPILPDKVKINKFNPEVIKPKYILKINKKENKIIIILELSSYKDLNAIVEIKKNYYLIIIVGEVKVNIPEKAEKIYNNIEEGPIYLPIRLSFDKCLLKSITPEINENIIKFDILSSTKNIKEF